MAKSVTRYDEAGNAVIREARPASNVRTAPRDVKAKGPAAIAAWNRANKPQPGKTGAEATRIVERQIYKRAADMRAKKTIANTARSFSGGQLLEALSANNGPKVAPDAPVTQKRAAIASGMAARAANRTEAGGSDGAPKRRAAERFARVARGEKPFGGTAVAKTSEPKKESGASKAAQREAAFWKSRSGTPKTKGMSPKDRVVKLTSAVDARVRAAGRDAFTTEAIKRRNSRIDRITDAAGLTNIRGRSPSPAVADPAKVIEKRNETARSLAEQKKATGVDAGRGAAARDLVARNDRDLGRAGGSKPRGVGRAGQLIIAEAEGHMMQVARDTEGKVKFDGRRVDTVEKAKAYLKARGLPATTAEIKSKAATPKSRAEMPSAMAAAPPRDPAVAEANRAAGRERREALIASEKAADERMAAKPAKASRAGKAKTPRTVSIMGDNKYLTGDDVRGLTNAQKDAMVVKGGPPPSFIDKVNAAQAASDAARKNAPKPPATPPGPRDHWNRIGADGPKLKDVVRPGPGQPVGTLTEQQKLALVKSHGMGGAMVASQMPTHPPRGVTNDSAMGMASDQAKRVEARTAYNKAGGTDQRGRMFEALSGQPRVTSDWRTTLAKANTGLAVVGTGVAAAQAFNKAKQEGKSTGEAMGAGALAAAPGALMLGAQPIGNALSKAGGGMLKVAEGMAGALGPMGPISTPAMAVTGSLAAGGMAAQAAGAALKIAGKVAAPAMAAWGAYQGAKEDDNKLRGAARGALRSLDPSAIVTGIGAGTGLMKDGRGFGERAYDAAFGGPTQGRLSSTQAQTFAKADTNYDHMGMLAPPPPKDNRGWSPQARIAAYEAKFPMGTNAPYGGDPTNAPGYTPPKDRRPY